MNVSLVSKKNVPDDAIISIRSGAVRRQGAANANKPFVFPQSAVDGGDCVVKVDIMQNIGSGYIVLRPNQKEGRQYEVILGDNDMACEIKIDPTGVESPSAPAEDDAATAKTKQAAKQYLDGTGLLPFVQGVLQVVAKQQPQDPFAAMAKHFNSASDEAVAPMPGSPKAAPTSPTKSAPESPKAAPEPEDKGDSAEAAKESPPADEAAADGAEPGSPKNVEAPDEGEQKASPPAAEEAAPAEGQAEASKAEDDVDDHKSVDDVDVQFTATIRGKNLAAEAEEEKPTEQEDKSPTEEEKPTEQAEEEKPSEEEEKNTPEEEKPNENPAEEEKPNEQEENPTEEAKEE